MKILKGIIGLFILYYFLAGFAPLILSMLGF